MELHWVRLPLFAPKFYTMTKEEFKEKVLSFEQSIKDFEKENRYSNLSGVIKNVKRPLTKLIGRFNIPGKNRFSMVTDGTGTPPPTPKREEEPLPENSKVLASNAETPKAKSEQAKKRRSRKKKSEE